MLTRVMVSPTSPDEQTQRQKRALALRLVLAALAIALILWFVAGCTTTPIPPTYTPEELQAKCTRTGGWWRSNLIDGYCEYQLPNP